MPRLFLTTTFFIAGSLSSGYASAETVSLVCTPTSDQGPAIHWVINDRSMIENEAKLGYTAPVFTNSSIAWNGLVRPTAPGSSAAYASDISINMDRNSTEFSRNEVYRGPQVVISEKSVKGTCALEPKGQKTF